MKIAFYEMCFTLCAIKDNLQSFKTVKLLQNIIEAEKRTLCKSGIYKGFLTALHKNLPEEYKI